MSNSNQLFNNIRSDGTHLADSKVNSASSSAADYKVNSFSASASSSADTKSYITFSSYGDVLGYDPQLTTGIDPDSKLMMEFYNNLAGYNVEFVDNPPSEATMVPGKAYITPNRAKTGLSTYIKTPEGKLEVGCLTRLAKNIPFTGHYIIPQNNVLHSRNKNIDHALYHDAMHQAVTHLSFIIKKLKGLDLLKTSTIDELVKVKLNEENFQNFMTHSTFAHIIGKQHVSELFKIATLAEEEKETEAVKQELARLISRDMLTENDLLAAEETKDPNKITSLLTTPFAHGLPKDLILNAVTQFLDHSLQYLESKFVHKLRLCFFRDTKKETKKIEQTQEISFITLCRLYFWMGACGSLNPLHIMIQFIHHFITTNEEVKTIFKGFREKTTSAQSIAMYLSDHLKQLSLSELGLSLVEALAKRLAQGSRSSVEEKEQEIAVKLKHRDPTTLRQLLILHNPNFEKYLPADDKAFGEMLKKPKKLTPEIRQTLKMICIPHFGLNLEVENLRDDRFPRMLLWDFNWEKGTSGEVVEADDDLRKQYRNIPMPTMTLDLASFAQSMHNFYAQEQKQHTNSNEETVSKTASNAQAQQTTNSKPTDTDSEWETDSDNDDENDQLPMHKRKDHPDDTDNSQPKGPRLA